MLVLSRKVGEELVLKVDGRTIRVVVIKVTGGSVKLGTDAPDDVLVLRKELCDDDVLRGRSDGQR